MSLLRSLGLVLLAITIVALLSITAFGIYQVCDQPANAKQEYIESSCKGWHWLSHDAAGLFTAALAVITGLLAYYTYGLYRTTVELARDANKTADRAEDATRRQLRAYVFVKNLTVKIDSVQSFTSDRGFSSPAVLFGYDVTAVIENSGSTPTRHMVADINGLFSEEPQLPPDFAYPSARPEQYVIGPHAIGVTSTFRIPAHEMTGIAQGTRHCFVWGWIDYNDVFEGTARHRTEFCFKVGGQIPTGGGHIIPSFPAWGPFNGFDSDCMRSPAAPIH